MIGGDEEQIPGRVYKTPEAAMWGEAFGNSGFYEYGIIFAMPEPGFFDTFSTVGVIAWGKDGGTNITCHEVLD